MIYARRLRLGKDESAWALPFADLMTLLLVVFVMIVALSDVRPDRLAGIRRSMRGESARRSAMPPVAAGGRVELPRMGMRAESTQAAMIRLSGPDSTALPPCRVSSDDQQVAIQVAEEDAFMGPTAVLAPRTRKLIACLADQLRDGQAVIGVRGYGPRGELPPGLPYHDRVDLACQRARAVRAEMARGGVSEGRLTTSAIEKPAGEGGFEIVLHAGLP
ncbi:MAG: hypothetical protein HRF43_13465 [Phycisphaerae bacterium]|jgi:flagellar motor protein MotB